MAYLALVRHGESEWNKLGLWTGWTDVVLTSKGREEARHAGEVLEHHKIHFDRAFTSVLKRSKETLQEIESVLGEKIPATSNFALNERDYGNFDGLNKYEVEKQYGEELFEKWHRSWDYPIPHGETLKQVYERAVPYYKLQILPLLEKGENILVSAHGNSLRAVVKYLEDIPESQIPHLEIPTGGGFLYKLNKDGKISSKTIIK